MSAKNMDRQGRWRSVTVAFRVSPEEDMLIESAVRVSGLTKQDYIIRKLTDRDVIVQGNPKGLPWAFAGDAGDPGRTEANR